jgi:hypothetical protein
MEPNNIMRSSVFNRRQRRFNSDGNERRQKRKNIDRIYKRRARIPVNNEDTLSRIAQLPLQITNDSFASQLFHGSPFY